LTIKFYTDTHIAKAVTVQCQHHGVDIIRCEDVGLAEASDEEHLTYASDQGRVMVTSDRDFVELHKQYVDTGKLHAGILYILPEHKDDIGRVVRFIIDLHELIQGGAATLEQDINNQLYWL
jgi:hypothetical protein